MFNDLKGLFKNPQGNFIKITADKKVTKLKTNDKKPADNSSWRISSIIIVVILIIAIMTAISIILKYK